MKVTSGKVYRIENVEGKGPYTGRPSIIDEFYRPNDVRQPPPRCDTLLIENGYRDFRFKYDLDVLFGFSSVNHIHDWFYDIRWIHRMMHLGYGINVYHAKKVIHGRAQVVFYRRTAERIGKVEIHSREKESA